MDEFEIQRLPLHGYQGKPVPNLFFRIKQSRPALAVIFPGLTYSADMPLLFYTSALLRLRLARRLGVAESDLTHIRRGVLLHDIGKMGVPDVLLKKNGPLTEQEWVEMRKHPQYAYDLLHPITYLRPALDIPYCHHEKWDGSGYPRGLKGTQIPLAARMFAVTDVYDALSYDRPYRAAWPKQKVLDYVCGQSGKHFDPEVVEAFLNLLRDSASA